VEEGFSNQCIRKTMQKKIAKSVVGKSIFSLSAAPLTTPEAPSGQSLPYVDEPTPVNDSGQPKKPDRSDGPDSPLIRDLGGSRPGPAIALSRRRQSPR
jgi:hypothetical protein